MTKQEKTAQAKSKMEQLNEAIAALLKQHGETNVFDALIEQGSSGIKYDCIQYLQINEGMNVVKVEGLNQQLKFEDAMAKHIPLSK